MMLAGYSPLQRPGLDELQNFVRFAHPRYEGCLLDFNFMEGGGNKVFNYGTLGGHAVIQGAGALASWDQGVFHPNASGLSYAQMPNHPGLLLTGDLTVMLRINMLAFAVGDMMCMIETGGGGSSSSQNEILYMGQGQTSGAIGVRYRHEYNSNQKQLREFTPAMVLNTWYWIGLVRNVISKTVSVYVFDGMSGDQLHEETQSYTSNPTNTNTVAPLALGAKPVTGAQELNCQFDYFRLYNRIVGINQLRTIPLRPYLEYEETVAMQFLSFGSAPASEAPTIGVPAAQALFSDTNNIILGATIGDNEGGLITMDFSCTHGTLGFETTVPGVTVVGAGTNAMTATGIISTLTPLLTAGICYHQDGILPDTILIDAEDPEMNAATQKSIAITLKSKPIHLDVEPSVISPNTLTPLTFGFTDREGNATKSQVSVLHGVLSVTLSGAASIAPGSNNSATMTINGTQADILATLDTLTYDPTPGYVGPEVFSAVTTDADGHETADMFSMVVSGASLIFQQHLIRHM